MFRRRHLLVPTALVVALCALPAPASDESKKGATNPHASHGHAAGPHVVTPIEIPEEKHFSNVRMLTERGENAEAYWSFDGKRLVFQARRGEEGCDRIRTMRPNGRSDELVTASGAHTCAFFLPGDKRIVWASTRTGGEDCPPKPDYSLGYVWPIYESYEIYSSWLDGSGVRRLTNSPGYDAEATVAPDGTIVFTSTRDGDLDIYTMDSDGRNVRRLTWTPGYDGGPFFSPDGSLIAYRAYHPKDDQELADFRALLEQNLVRPGHLDLWVMNKDGSNKRRITDMPGASFAPSFLPGNTGLIFSTNFGDPRGRNFDLYKIDMDGTGLERVTWNESFDGFPMFSPDGEQLVFCSNRGNLAPNETNVFMVDWVD